MRVGWLMIKSIGWIGAGAFLAVLLGLFAAIAVLYWQPERLSRLVKPAFLMIIIPNFIYVQSWIYCMDTINGIINDLLHTSFNFTGSFAYLWVFAMASFPLTFGFSLFALQSVPKEIAYLVAMDGGFQHHHAIDKPVGNDSAMDGCHLANHHGRDVRSWFCLLFSKTSAPKWELYSDFVLIDGGAYRIARADVSLYGCLRG